VSGSAASEGGEELAFKDDEVAATLRLSVAEMRRLMPLLLRDKILNRMGADALYIRQSALAQLRARISELGSRTLDVTRFKLLTGHAIPVLEYLDRERGTRKDGDQDLVI
jgi:selenocysteine-specific elongation factor